MSLGGGTRLRDWPQLGFFRDRHEERVTICSGEKIRGILNTGGETESEKGERLSQSFTGRSAGCSTCETLVFPDGGPCLADPRIKPLELTLPGCRTGVVCNTPVLLQDACPSYLISFSQAAAGLECSSVRSNAGLQWESLAGFPGTCGHGSSSDAPELWRREMGTLRKAIPVTLSEAASLTPGETSSA